MKTVLGRKRFNPPGSACANQQMDPILKKYVPTTIAGRACPPAKV